MIYIFLNRIYWDQKSPLENFEIRSLLLFIYHNNAVFTTH
jgi:hypothetical protein